MTLDEQLVMVSPWVRSPVRSTIDPAGTFWIVICVRT
jgi:hypothetical protein